jgi:hypothetical protein
MTCSCYDCNPSLDGEDLIRLWKPELGQFLDNLKTAQMTVSESGQKAIFLYDDQVEDLKHIITRLLEIV